MKCSALTPVLFLLLLTHQVAAQHGQPSSNGYTKPGHFIFKFCVPALFDDFSFPTIQAGIEYKISPRLSWYNEFGIKYRNGAYKTDTSFVASRGFKAKTEWRYYLAKERRRTQPFGAYFGVNLFFTRDYHNTEIGYYSHDDSSSLRKDAFSVHKDVAGGNLLFGFERIFAGHWGIDVYGGLGLRVRNVKTDHEEYNDKLDKFNGGIDFNIYNFRQQTDASPGISTTGNLTVGIRFCYRL